MRPSPENSECALDYWFGLVHIVVSRLLNQLDRYKEAGRIDIGANIGMYTIPAAKMGFKVKNNLETHANCIQCSADTLLIHKSPTFHSCLHYDLCDVQIDWFHWYMNIVNEVMLENIRYMAIIDNKKLHILFTELSNSVVTRHIRTFALCNFCRQ